MAVEILTKEATDIVITASQSIDTFKSTSGFYPTIDNVAAETQGTLPLDENVTLQDIEDASAILTLKYPTIMNSSQYETNNAFLNEFKISLADRIIEKTTTSRTLAIIFILAFIGYMVVSNRR